MENKVRPKLSVEEQIEHMKSKGILFTIIDEETAKSYLNNNTYYFKLKAYNKLFSKDINGKYIGLEFAYLKDLATIDSLLRKKILSIAIDIEHYLKVALLRDFNNSDEDGYSIVEDFRNSDSEKFDIEINRKLKGKACSNLVRKYKDNFAIWNIIEILTFSDFQTLYTMFYTRQIDEKLKEKPNFNANKHVPYYYLFNPVRLLRNAAAHSNCLINSLKDPYISEEEFNENYNVAAFLGQSKKISNKRLHTQLSKPLVHDFCVMLYLYHKVAPAEAQKHVFRDLREFFEKRIAKNGNYYKSNSTLCSAYEFVIIVIEFFCESIQN